VNSQVHRICRQGFSWKVEYALTASNSRNEKPHPPNFTPGLVREVRKYVVRLAQSRNGVGIRIREGLSLVEGADRRHILRADFKIEYVHV